MAPSNLAKSLGAKSLAEVARAYDTHQSYLTRLHDSDKPRLERMIKVHVLAKQMGVDTKHLQFMLEYVTDTLKQTNAADYFVSDEKARMALTRALIDDFCVRMKLLYRESLEYEVREDIEDSLLYMVKGCK